MTCMKISQNGYNKTNLSKFGDVAYILETEENQIRISKIHGGGNIDEIDPPQWYI